MVMKMMKAFIIENPSLAAYIRQYSLSNLVCFHTIKGIYAIGTLYMNFFLCTFEFYVLKIEGSNLADLGAYRATEIKLGPIT